jgi:hypothetical protein
VTTPKKLLAASNLTASLGSSAVETPSAEQEGSVVAEEIAPEPIMGSEDGLFRQK